MSDSALAIALEKVSKEWLDASMETIDRAAIIISNNFKTTCNNVFVSRIGLTIETNSFDGSADEISKKMKAFQSALFTEVVKCTVEFLCDEAIQSHYSSPSTSPDSISTPEEENLYSLTLFAINIGGEDEIPTTFQDFCVKAKRLLISNPPPSQHSKLQQLYFFLFSFEMRIVTEPIKAMIDAAGILMSKVYMCKALHSLSNILSAGLSFCSVSNSYDNVHTKKILEQLLMNDSQAQDLLNLIPWLHCLASLNFESILERIKTLSVIFGRYRVLLTVENMFDLYARQAMLMKTEVLMTYLSREFAKLIRLRNKFRTLFHKNYINEKKPLDFLESLAQLLTVIKRDYSVHHQQLSTQLRLSGSRNTPSIRVVMKKSSEPTGKRYISKH